MPRGERGAVAVHPASDRPSGERVARVLRHEAPGLRHVTVIVLSDVSDLEGMLLGLAETAAEVVLVGRRADTAGDAAVGVALAVKGEDFVFEVPTLAVAMGWAREAAARPDIEGDAVLVVGAAATLSAVRAALEDQASP